VNTVNLDMNNVLNMPDGDSFAFPAAHSSHALVINGNAGDQLHLVDVPAVGASPAATWQLAESHVDLLGVSGGHYDVYDLVRSGSVMASVAVDENVVKV
jgi:hypothetical protein